jgi:hypothetical protein
MPLFCLGMNMYVPTCVLITIGQWVGNDEEEGRLRWTMTRTCTMHRFDSRDMMRKVFIGRVTNKVNHVLVLFWVVGIVSRRGWTRDDHKQGVRMWGSSI